MYQYLMKLQYKVTICLSDRSYHVSCARSFECVLMDGCNDIPYPKAIGSLLVPPAAGILCRGRCSARSGFVTARCEVEDAMQVGFEPFQWNWSILYGLDDRCGDCVKDATVDTLEFTSMRDREGKTHGLWGFSNSIGRFNVAQAPVEIV